MLEIANLIPIRQRKYILENNLIFKATPNEQSIEMQNLMIIWKEYVEPDLKITCNLCYSRILNNYIQLQPILINIEKEYKLLENA